MNIQAFMKIFSNESGFDEDISKWRCGFDVRTLFLLESFLLGVEFSQGSWGCKTRQEQGPFTRVVGRTKARDP
jgi:hypothetical protein